MKKKICRKKRLNLFDKCIYLKINGACTKPSEFMCIEFTDEQISSLPRKSKKF